MPGGEASALALCLVLLWLLPALHPSTEWLFHQRGEDRFVGIQGKLDQWSNCKAYISLLVEV